MTSGDHRPRRWLLLKWLPVCFLTMPAATSIGQLQTFEESWRWARFTTETGLPSDQIFCIAETPAGTVWVGTKSGLAWFDNYGWHAIDSAKGIRPRRITHIESIGRDSILVLSEGALYAGNLEGFSQLVPNAGRAGGVQSAVLAPNGKILVLFSQNLCVYESSRLTPVKIPANPISTGTRNLWRTESGEVWLNTVRGLYKGDGNKWKSVLPVEKYDFTLLSVSEYKKGNGLAAVSSPREVQGIREWTRNHRPVLSLTERLGTQQAMDMSPNGDVIVVYESGDIRIRHRDVWSSLEPRPEEFTSTQAIKFRANGDLWVGTERGLFLFRGSSNRWTYWRHPFGDLRNGVHEIYRSSDGSIWLGTLKGIEIHRPGGRVDYIERILGIELGTVTGIVEDKNNNIWICSGASFPGAFRWDGRNWKHFGVSEGLRAERVHKIRKDRSGRLWFLGLSANYKDWTNQPGAFQLENGEFIHWGERDSTHDGLVSGRVYGFAEGVDGARWFATLGGISRWKNGTWKHWTKDDGLLGQNQRVYAIVVDSAGTVWFTNVSAGLGTIDGRDNVHFLTIADGLVNDAIWDLKPDETGALWISTERGLSCYKNGIWSNYTIRNGLSTPNLWDVLPLKDVVYVGSPGAGVNILNRIEKIPPPIIRFAKASVEGTTALLRWTALPYLGNIEPKEVETRYRIDNDEWSGWTPDREAYLADLSSGDHTFTVQVKGIYSSFNKQEGSLRIHVDPYLYQRPTVLIPVSGLTVLLLVLGGAYLRRKGRYNRELQQGEERFRLLASSTTDTIYDWNLKTNELWSNSSDWGSPEYMHADPKTGFELWLSRVHPSDRQRVEKSITDALAARLSSWHAEYRAAKEDGTYQHVLYRGYLMYDDAGNLQRWIGSAMDITQRKQAEEFSRNISKHIIEAQEGERRRVSRELHDSVNQILASIKFRIESLEEHLPGRNARVKREARKTKHLLNKVMTEVRRISRNLRPAELDDLGLASAVRSLAEEFSERTEIAVTLDDRWPKQYLSPEMKLTLYRIIQESLTNVEKHAKAKRVKLTCTETENQIVCTIQDNGRGINADEHSKNRIRGSGLGLLDMKERLSFLGGTLEVSSNSRRGTTVTACIPLKPSLTTKQG